MGFRWLSLGLGLGIVASLVHCREITTDPCETPGACPTVGPVDSGGDGPEIDGGEVPIPPNCRPEADANSAEAKGCVVDSFALFVDGAGGNDSNTGTKDKPLKKIATAIAKAPAAGRKRIYVCGGGTYPEHLKLTAAVSLFGGFACKTWEVDPAAKPNVAPTDAGYALHVDGVTGEVRFEDVGFEAVAGTAASRSSIAVFVASSPSVTFKRAEIKAGLGFDGKDGEVGTTGVSTPADLDGNPGADVAGGEAKTCKCSTGGESVGGAGGDVNGTGIDGTAGMPTITPALPSAENNGAGQTQVNCNGTKDFARPGSNAPPAAAAPGAKLGVLDANGWSPGDGAAGQAGGPGQGGGGGGSRTNVGSNNGGGGGGGCGGCGGSGGTGGEGGGASIALLAFSSPVKLVGASLSAGKAGKGGSGKAGGPGGGGGGGGLQFKSGCPGNTGGSGGTGGAGAGGAGGVSAAVLHKNGAPVNEGSTLNAGAKGVGGAGGKSPGNDGPAGLEGPVVAAP